MASTQFLSPAIKYVPQSGFSASYTENGGVEASQDFIVRNSDLASRNDRIAGFVRGATWESLWPEVPDLYRNLTLKNSDPTDQGNGLCLLRVTFTGYSSAGTNGSSGEEESVATTSLLGQLEDVALAQHYKWEALSSDFKYVLGQLISGQAETKFDFTQVGTYVDGDSKTPAAFNPIENASGAITLTGDAIVFAKIIASGETTFKKGGWTYSYHTESEAGFSPAQLNSLGKIVASPPGNPTTPTGKWKWLLTSPNQTQSGTERFMKTLDFQLIRDNAANNFLYG